MATRASTLLPWRHLSLCALALLLFLVFLSSFHLPIFFPALGGIHGSLPVLGIKQGSAFISQLPSRRSARAILFLAHGCGCRAAFFWDKSPSCPHCVGLPEERLFVLKALQERYAVIAISSTGNCWARKPDTDKVISILTGWIRENALERLPIFALGASSGGYFVSTLALRMRFNATVLMISEGHFEAMDFDRSYPATLFVHMPRDEQRAIGVSRSMKLLKEKGVETREIKCEAFSVSARLLSDRIPGMSLEVAQEIYTGLKEAGILDENDLMKRDGRAVRWRTVLEQRGASTAILNEWEHHIQEELNVAFAYHEMTSSSLSDIFDWFARHAQ